MNKNLMMGIPKAKLSIYLSFPSVVLRDMEYRLMASQ